MLFRLTGDYSPVLAMFAIHVYCLSGQPLTGSDPRNSNRWFASYLIRTAITVYLIQCDANKPSSWSIPSFISSFLQSTVRYSGFQTFQPSKQVSDPNIYYNFQQFSFFAKWKKLFHFVTGKPSQGNFLNRTHRNFCFKRRQQNKDKIHVETLHTRW